MSTLHMGNILTFNGLAAQQMSLATLRDTDSITSFGDQFQRFIPSLKQAELSCDIVCFLDDGGYAQIESMIEKLWDHSNKLVNLGPGYVCEYCGEYKVSGELKCHRCGGTTKEEQFVAVSSFPFLLTDYQVNTPYNDLTVLSLNMRSIAPVTNFVLEQLTKGVSLETLPHALMFDPSKYLCEFCGMVVESGRTCPGCGGIRLPLGEVVKMDRDCIYCGKRVTGGIVCKSCGARLSGLSYRIARGEFVC